MANRIKGITVEIGGDTTRLSKALEGVNKTIKTTQTQLKDVEKLLKLDPKNTELLSQKQKLLADSISATKEKLATLKTAAEQANAALAKGDITQEQYDALQREIIETEQLLKPNRNFATLKVKPIKPLIPFPKLVRRVKFYRMSGTKFPMWAVNLPLMLQFLLCRQELRL